MIFFLGEISLQTTRLASSQFMLNNSDQIEIKKFPPKTPSGNFLETKEPGWYRTLGLRCLSTNCATQLDTGRIISFYR